MPPQWKRQLQARLIVPIVAFCAVSVVALSQVRMLCELGDKLHSANSHSHSSPGSSLDSSHDSSADGTEHHNGSTDEGTHTRKAVSSGDATHSHDHAHSGASDSEEGEESCCDSISSGQWASGPTIVQVEPSSFLHVLVFTILRYDPSILAVTKEQLRLSRSNAPPPLSLSHIPTTVLLI